MVRFTVSFYRNIGLDTAPQPTSLEFNLDCRADFAIREDVRRSTGGSGLMGQPVVISVDHDLYLTVVGPGNRGASFEEFDGRGLS